MLRNKNNRELFTLYDSDLILRVRNTRNLENDRRLLAKFAEYLNEFPPTPELAKGFLAQYTDRKPRTLARYAATIKAFMKWYGEPMDDFRIKVPRSLPAYTEESSIDKLFSAIENKKSHKGTITRDRLLVEMALKTGMRRGELANLEPRDIHNDFLVVRHGKGDKDRMIPLTPATAIRLQNFTNGMAPDEKVFKLKPACISMKIKKFARKAGLEDFHCHSMRHKFATDLLESGVNIKVLQELLGHARLDTTEVYLSVINDSLHEAVKRLEKGVPGRDITIVVPRHKRSKLDQERGRQLAEKLWPATPELFNIHLEEVQ